MAANRFVGINLRLPEDLISETDRLAESEGTSRAEVVGVALRSYTKRLIKLHTAFGIVEKRGAAAGINTPGDVRAALSEIWTKP